MSRDSRRSQKSGPRIFCPFFLHPAVLLALLAMPANFARIGSSSTEIITWFFEIQPNALSSSTDIAEGPRAGGTKRIVQGFTAGKDRGQRREALLIYSCGLDP